MSYQTETSLLLHSIHGQPCTMGSAVVPHHVAYWSRIGHPPVPPAVPCTEFGQPVGYCGEAWSLDETCSESGLVRFDRRHARERLSPCIWPSNGTGYFDRNAIGLRNKRPDMTNLFLEITTIDNIRMHTTYTSWDLARNGYIPGVRTSEEVPSTVSVPPLCCAHFL